MCSYDTEASDGKSIERLGDEITRLAAHIHAATCRWLGLVAEFDRREGWAQWGCRSCAHWVSWRCSIAQVAAREHVRVARRLEELPMIRAAFAEGRLSYSKVRALTRVGAIEREEDLLELASDATAAQLERLVRAYRGVAAAEASGTGGRPPRWVAWDHADDGSLMLRARLPAEEGAIVLAALQGGVEWLAEQDNSASAEASDPAGMAGRPCVEAVDEAVSASAEAPVDLSERRADALMLMADTLLAGTPAARAGDRFQVVVHVDAAALQVPGTTGRCELDDGSPLATETGRRLACDAAVVRLRERNGRPLDLGRKTRAISPALRRALSSRDRGCRFPGCHSRRGIDAHHVRHWAHGGATNLDNLLQVCRHHHRLLHEGGFSVEPGGGGFRFRRPDGTEIKRVPRPPRGRTDGVLESPPARAPRIDSGTCVPGWAGQVLDVDMGVQALLSMAPLEAPGV